MSSPAEQFYLARADNRRVSAYYDDPVAALRDARYRALLLGKVCKVFRRSDHKQIAHSPAVRERPQPRPADAS